MRVLHVISSGGMYGAEAVILNMSRVLNEGSHTSVLAVFANSPNPNLQLHERAATEGIESHLVPCRGQLDRSAIAGIRDLAQQVKADVVHAHGYKADIYAYLALRGKAPLISTCHTWYDNDLTVRIYGAADRFVLRKYQRVVAVSDEVRQRLLKAGVREEKIRLIQNGIDLRPFQHAAPSLRDGLEVDQPLIGLVGRLAPEKGVDIFLRAASRVLARMPASRFVVVGDGPDRTKLESLIDELHLRQHVSLLGQRSDMPSVYASLDVMVSASRQEGLPIAILEGMASNRALVATAVGEVPSVIANGRTGVLVPAPDEGLLAEAIVNLLSDPERRARLGMAAAQLVADEFSAERMTQDYLRTYEEARAAQKAAR
ncbi:glycosyltransferase family 4 protein [Edaphobacter sp.]|uniref:glycosyltransferase family 4 protein n=1 Tax=Edaphobacter sp. TaxID=1934404 RepID=UPI002DBA6A7A|nr:glycosyltransferase family 4 protein [Edaphobacter sp.]HEU5340727.1 glycosyltransferase family 4 protein [Edaphobacter sp.]